MPTLQDSKSSISTDPVRNFKYHVNIHKNLAAGGESLARLGFMNMSGLSATTSTIPYREGGNNTTQRKMPGQTDFADITLSRGVTLGHNQPWSWMLELFHVNQGSGSGSVGNDFRCEIDVLVLAHPVTAPGDTPAYVKYKIYNAWLSGLSYSELDAGGNAVYVEQMSIVHEGFQRFLAANEKFTVEGRKE
ncbi:MAG: phage tail protein [Dermatophilaceae bacterium]|nr:phage tail protein [Intrasporangiaceae bacterium]